MGKQCEVCKEAESKYKCPACLTPYCSLLCYKKHKETPCSKSEPTAKEAEKLVEAQPPHKPEESDATSHRLRRSQLEAVASSEEIRNMLKDKELQEFIKNIDSSSNSKQELEKAMEGPTFREFTDKLLTIISPEDHVPEAIVTNPLATS